MVLNWWILLCPFSDVETEVREVKCPAPDHTISDIKPEFLCRSDWLYIYLCMCIFITWQYLKMFLILMVYHDILSSCPKFIYSSQCSTSHFTSRQSKNTQTHSVQTSIKSSSQVSSVSPHITCHLQALTRSQFSYTKLLWHSPVKAVSEVSNDFFVPMANIFYHLSWSAFIWVLPEKDLVVDSSLRIQELYFFCKWFQETLLRWW